MINLRKGTSRTIYFTGTEQSVLDSPFFLFICVSRSTGSTVRFVATNTSEYTERYDKALITVNTFFLSEDTGMWSYKIYEQVSSSNTNPDGLTMVEEGLLNLLPAEDAETTEYAGQSNEFKTYGE